MTPPSPAHGARLPPAWRAGRLSAGFKDRDASLEEDGERAEQVAIRFIPEPVEWLGDANS